MTEDKIPGKGAAELSLESIPEYLEPLRQSVFANYEFVAEKGTGANGIAYEIKHKKDLHSYCLKLIHPKFTEETDFLRVKDSLEKEVRILKPLNHLSLPRIYEENFSGPRPYYISTFHPGVTFESFRKQKATLSPDESYFVIRSLLDAIRYLHERGRTHCDLHQENVLISSKVFGEGILIIDFGSGHRNSSDNRKTDDRGWIGGKNVGAIARHRRNVDRSESASDFQNYDFRALGASLWTMHDVFFFQAPIDQIDSFKDFCERLHNGNLRDWNAVELAFQYVVDPARLYTIASHLFLSDSDPLSHASARPTLTLPGTRAVPFGDPVEKVVETAAFQRLRGISQLSFCDWAYPGATHTRYEHSLGVFGVAIRALEQVSQQRHFKANFQKKNILGFLFASLVHDVGHYPFAHVIEHYVAARFSKDNELRSKVHHFENGLDILKSDLGLAEASRYWKQEEIIEEAETVLRGQRGFLSLLLDGSIDCDKIDYLRRDSLHSGTAYGRGFDRNEILRSLRCSEDGRELHISSDAVHAVEGFLILQNQMLAGVYWHPKVRSIFAMFHRFLDGTVGSDTSALIELVHSMKSCYSENECVTKIFLPLLDGSPNKKTPSRGTREELEPLLSPIMSPNKQGMFSPIARYRRDDELPMRFIGAFASVFSTIVTDPATADRIGAPIIWDNVRRLRSCFKNAIEKSNIKCGRCDVLVDVPWGKGANRILTVVDDEKGKPVSITRRSHLDSSIFQNIAQSAPIQVFVSPDIFRKISDRRHLIAESAILEYFDQKNKTADDDLR